MRIALKSSLSCMGDGRLGDKIKTINNTSMDQKEQGHGHHLKAEWPT